MESPFDTWLNRGVGAVTLWATVGGSSLMASVLAKAAGLPRIVVTGIAVGSAFAVIGVWATAVFVVRRLQTPRIGPPISRERVSPLEHYIVEKIKYYEERERQDRSGSFTDEGGRRGAKRPVPPAQDFSDLTGFSSSVVDAIEAAIYFKPEIFHESLRVLRLPPFPEKGAAKTADERLARVRALVWFYNEEVIRRSQGISNGRPEELHDPRPGYKYSRA